MSAPHQNTRWSGSAISREINRKRPGDAWSPIGTGQSPWMSPPWLVVLHFGLGNQMSPAARVVETICTRPHIKLASRFCDPHLSAYAIGHLLTQFARAFVARSRGRPLLAR